jgi:hypothetical protein
MKRLGIITSMVVLGLAASASAQGPGTTVIDSVNRLVGYQYTGQGYLLYMIGKNWYYVYPGVTINGILAYPTSYLGNGTTVYYTSANCTGTPYLPINGLAPNAYFTSPSNTSEGEVSSAIIYYPTSPYQTLPIGSYLASGNCNATSGMSYVGAMGTSSLSVALPLILQ